MTNKKIFIVAFGAIAIIMLTIAEKLYVHKIEVGTSTPTITDITDITETGTTTFLVYRMEKGECEKKSKEIYKKTMNFIKENKGNTVFVFC